MKFRLRTISSICIWRCFLRRGGNLLGRRRIYLLRFWKLAICVPWLALPASGKEFAELETWEGMRFGVEDYIS